MIHLIDAYNNFTKIIITIITQITNQNKHNNNKNKFM